MVIENTHDKVSLKNENEMLLSVMWQILCSVEKIQDREVVLIKTLEVDVIKNKYQLGPRDKCFQLISTFHFYFV